MYSGIELCFNEGLTKVPLLFFPLLGVIYFAFRPRALNWQVKISQDAPTGSAGELTPPSVSHSAAVEPRHNFIQISSFCVLFLYKINSSSSVKNDCKKQKQNTDNALVVVKSPLEDTV